MVGGGGRRVLSLAAREADIVSLNFNNRSGVLGPDGVRSGTAGATAEKLGWIRAAAGARFASLELEIGAYFTFVQPGAEKIAAQLGQSLGLTPDEMLRHPHGLFGSVDSVCEELERRRAEYGISYVTVTDTALESFAPVVARLSGK
jgi:alkanesulfonate monooxygenase SsuD/methylene tetrahydromethanopterin reductase-like flavin-dependent oxidoreductase (luciferase family)